MWGMLPKNKLSRQLIGKLKVYSRPGAPAAAGYEVARIAQ